MNANLIVLSFWLWVLAAVLALFHRGQGPARFLLGVGCLLGIVAALVALPGEGASVSLRISLAGQPVRFEMTPAGWWLLGFGLMPAMFACWLGSPGAKPGIWLFGAAMSLIGALGVFGMRDGMAFLIAWELMSLGGGLMLFGERLRRKDDGKPALFMLGLLEVGAVALLCAVLLLDQAGGGMAFHELQRASAHFGDALWLFVALLFLIGFGAKLGLIPFYEWFPRAYASGSGGTGALFSGVILNAAFHALDRSWNIWMADRPDSNMSFALAIIVIAVGVASAVLAIFYALQEADWRALLSYSSAENASVAVAMLGVCRLFLADGLQDLAGLAWTVAMLHLAGHSLAKGALFLSADGVFRSTGNYGLMQRGWLRANSLIFGVGAVFCAMSLAAIPPQAGFVSEWYVFQTVFQGFHLNTFGGRLALVLAGAGLALAAAVSLATFVKLFGIGLLGGGTPQTVAFSRGTAWSVGVLGLAVLALAVGMPVWLGILGNAAYDLLGAHSAQLMVSGWLLVPLTDTFAFISPSKLIIVMPLLSLLPIGLLVLGRRRRVRRAAVWYGGGERPSQHTATTPLTFANAMRTFYSFVYQPSMSTMREHDVREYFIKRLVFRHGVTDLFDNHVFQPAIRFVTWCAQRFRALQSGNLNLYLAFIGGLLVAILALILW